MPNNPSMAAAIVGAAESNKIGYIEEGTTATKLHLEAIINVCKQTGIHPSEIEGVFSTGFSPQIAEHLGIHPKYMDTTAVGGCSFIMHVHHALAAINAGIIDIAVVSHGEAGYSARKNKGNGTNRGLGEDRWSVGNQFEVPYGIAGAPSNYAHAMTRHMHQYGTTKEDFAQIAVVTRDWATLNPRAVMHSKDTHPAGGPMTVQDVLNSRLIAWPLNLLDICLVTDHGGAVIVASAEKARSLRTRPVWIAGAGENTSHSSMLEMGDFTATSAAASANSAYKMAGMGPGEMELAMIYDSFTITVAVMLEDLGFCKKGEVGDFVTGQNLRWDRPGLTLNTDGGGLSSNHPGMRGLFLLLEATRQLRGESTSQVAGAKLAVAHGNGGMLGSTHAGGTVILAAD
ncbi:MAG: thiolase [Chloroflexota bacterium]